MIVNTSKRGDSFLLNFIQFFFKFFFFHVAVPGFSCGMHDLRSSLQCGNVGSGSLHGWSPAHLHWERRVSATGLPRKSLSESSDCPLTLSFFTLILLT